MMDHQKHWESFFESKKNNNNKIKVKKNVWSFPQRFFYSRSGWAPGVSLDVPEMWDHLGGFSYEYRVLAQDWSQRLDLCLDYLQANCSHEIKRHLLLGRKVMTNLDSIFKSRDIANKGPSSQGYGFSSGHVWMWELDCE